MDPLYKPNEAYRCRQGPGISSEIETIIDVSKALLALGRQGPGISSEIETHFA